MTDDERLIRRIVDQMEAAWNRGDSAAFTEPFADDADFVDVLGNYHRGRAAIEAGHRQIFDTIYKGSVNSYTVEHVRFVRPDVAVAFVRARLRSYLGTAVDDPVRTARVGGSMRGDEARPTMVLAKADGRWRVVAFQNTRVAEVRPSGDQTVPPN